MNTELTNGFGKAYLTISYDEANDWVYNNWVGYQTFEGVVKGADACLRVLREHNQCAYLLNDNRQVIGPWDHAVEWIVADWAPRAIAQGLLYFANVVSPESMAALSAEAMHLGLDGALQMRMFSDMEAAHAWLREAQASRQPVPFVV